MKSIVDTLSLPAQQLLEYLIATKQLQLVENYSWTAYLDKGSSRITFIPRNKMVTLYQLDYRTGMLAFLELLKARQITIDELSDHAWRFHLVSETCHQFS